MKRGFVILAAVGLFSCGGGGSGTSSLETGNGNAPVTGGSCTTPATAAYAAACALGRGVNLGNALDGPNEGEWGVSLNDDVFDRIKEAGFATMRLTVRWSNHAAATTPYTIDPAFMARVDYAVKSALDRGLYVVLDMHHYRQLDGDTRDAGEFAVADAVLEDRMVAMWQQIAEHFKDSSSKLLFEPYNEPHGRQTAAKWNALLARVLETVRVTNPTRLVVVGPVQWNNASALKDLVLPKDPNLIATIHNYEPFQFTHQGADWVSGSSSWLGTGCCDATQRAQIVAPLDIAARWSQATQIPVWVGEFGAYEKAPAAARVAYTRFIRDEMEKRGMKWAYWEFASGFGLYKQSTGAWNVPLRDALLGP